EQLAHAHPAFAEPAERVLVEARVPVLRREIGADATTEFRRDAIGRLAERGERLASRLARAGKHRVDRRPQEPAVAAGRGEDVELPVVGPAAESVRIDAKEAARLAERQPIAAREGFRGDAVNLGETGMPRSRWWVVSK